jgi:hypothetical protein
MHLISAEKVKTSLDAVQRWVEATNYRGYEPFDGLSSPLRPLMMGNLFAERLLMQLIRQSPVNLRPLLGVTPKDSTKGQGYMAWGYLILYRATGQEDYLTKALKCLTWLDKNKVARFKNHSWSNHFDFVSRGGGYSKDDPIIVWTALIGHAYVEAYEITQDNRWLKIADSICGWIMALPREKTESGTCISYLPHVQSSIHNSNMLGAAILSRTAQHTGNKEYLSVAREGMLYSCSRQLPDGAWLYGEANKYHWIDNFHTGYNLESLRWYSKCSGNREFQNCLDLGLAYFKANFFEPSGRPKYYHNRTYPVDIQCAGQAIETLAEFSDHDPDCLNIASRVASWTITNMQDAKGYFYYRQYPLVKAKTPMLHWGQGTMFVGLAVLFSKLSKAQSANAFKGKVATAL